MLWTAKNGNKIRLRLPDGAFLVARDFDDESGELTLIKRDDKRSPVDGHRPAVVFFGRNLEDGGLIVLQSATCKVIGKHEDNGWTIYDVDDVSVRHDFVELKKQRGAEETSL